MKDIRELNKKIFRIYSECGDLMLDLGELTKMLNDGKPTERMEHLITGLVQQIDQLHDDMLDLRKNTSYCKSQTAAEID